MSCAASDVSQSLVLRVYHSLHLICTCFRVYHGQLLQLCDVGSGRTANFEAAKQKRGPGSFWLKTAYVRLCDELSDDNLSPAFVPVGRSSGR
jgi:hypothetical protein